MFLTGQWRGLLARSATCKPHGLAVQNDKILYSCTASHQVKFLSSNEIVVGSGEQGRKYGTRDGTAHTARLTQPTGITVVGNTLYICDSAESSVLQCSGTGGLAKFHKHLGIMLNAFHVHTGEKNTHWRKLYQ